MTSRRKLLLAAFLSFVAGSVLTTAASYVHMRSTFDFWAAVPYESAASTGRLYAKMLHQLRDGQTDRATRTLEALLDTELITLSRYEEAIPESRRDRGVYQAARDMRMYRSQYPTTQPDAPTRASIERGLALGDF
jgi:hypothetical protein